MNALTILEHAAERAFGTRFGEKLGAQFFPWQAKMIDSSAQLIAIACSRRVGKSWSVSYKAAHHARTTPGGLTLMIAPTERQSKAIFSNTKKWLVRSGEPLVKAIETTVVLRNGHRIYALPGTPNTIRGTEDDPTLIVIDEAAFASDALYEAVDPMMAAGGCSMILLSTPFGKRGFFYEIFENGGSEWDRYRVTAYDSERIDQEWLERKRRTVPYHVFQQEYMAEFTEVDDAVFRAADIAMMEQERRPFFSELGTLDLEGDPENEPLFVGGER